jgi:hypothetical protein
MPYNNLHEYQKADIEKRQNRQSRRGPILTVDKILSLSGNYVLNSSKDGQAAIKQVKLWEQQEAEAKKAADSGIQSRVDAPVQTSGMAGPASAAATRTVTVTPPVAASTTAQRPLATTVTAAPPPTSSSNSGLRALGATPPASSNPSRGQQPKGQGVDTASSLTSNSVRASSVTPQAPVSQPLAGAVRQEGKMSSEQILLRKFEPNPLPATSAKHRQGAPIQTAVVSCPPQHQKGTTVAAASMLVQRRHEQPGSETGGEMVTEPPLYTREQRDRDSERHRPPVSPSASAAVFTPVVDPSYADFLQKLKDAMKTINSQQRGIWTQTADPSSRKTINNSWTNNTHHIKVSAIQDSTSGQASLVVEPTEATKLKSKHDFRLYFINMFDVMAHTGNKYSLVSPGVENLLKGLAADSGANISLVREGLKAAIEYPNFKTKFEGFLHDSTRKAFEAQAALAPSAAASGSHGPGAGAPAPGTTASGATHSAAAGPSMGGLPPNTNRTGLAGSGPDSDSGTVLTH